jgi:hypothetical protein
VAAIRAVFDAAEEQRVVEDYVVWCESPGGLSKEKNPGFVEHMRDNKPDVFRAAHKAYVGATASLCKAAS